jgi:hypothetical protein
MEEGRMKAGGGTKRAKWGSGERRGGHRLPVPLANRAGVLQCNAVLAFVESLQFTAQVLETLADEDYRKFQLELAA